MSRKGTLMMAVLLLVLVATISQAEDLVPVKALQGFKVWQLWDTTDYSKAYPCWDEEDCSFIAYVCELNNWQDEDDCRQIQVGQTVYLPPLPACYKIKSGRYWKIAGSHSAKPEAKGTVASKKDQTDKITETPQAADWQPILETAAKLTSALEKAADSFSQATSKNTELIARCVDLLSQTTEAVKETRDLVKQIQTQGAQVASPAAPTNPKETDTNEAPFPATGSSAPPTGGKPEGWIIGSIIAFIILGLAVVAGLILRKRRRWRNPLGNTMPRAQKTPRQRVRKLIRGQATTFNLWPKIRQALTNLKVLSFKLISNLIAKSLKYIPRFRWEDNWRKIRRIAKLWRESLKGVWWHIQAKCRRNQVLIPEISPAERRLSRTLSLHLNAEKLYGFQGWTEFIVSDDISQRGDVPIILFEVDLAIRPGSRTGKPEPRYAMPCSFKTRIQPVFRRYIRLHLKKCATCQAAINPALRQRESEIPARVVSAS